ncbi:hypothetical protein WDU94_009718 [Cyamophila willieti]
MRAYFVIMFSQSCDMNSYMIGTLLQILPGLPYEVHVPIFTFLYLGHEPGAYLTRRERDCVLFTFTIVSVLSSDQVKTFSKNFKSITAKKAVTVELIRAANLFMKTTQLIINLNAVCGFPIPLKFVDGHNYWQGTILQQLYQFLYIKQKHILELFKEVCHCLKLEDREEEKYARPREGFCSLYKFLFVMNCWIELGLFDECMIREIRSQFKKVSDCADVSDSMGTLKI